MRHVILAMVVVIAAGEPARAQRATVRPWRDKGYLTVSGDYQTASSTFDGSLAFSKLFETETVTSTYKIVRVPGFDVAGGVRVWRNLAAGVNVTRFTKTNSAAVNASIPHPFFFNRARLLTGDAPGIVHGETAVHIQAAWVLPVANRWQLTFFGGPSIFNVTQTLVTDIAYGDSYPYDTATFVSASLEQQSKSKVGGHGGADVAYMFSRKVGVGAALRFSRATLSFSTANGQTVSVDGGGPQVGVGLRVRF